MTEQEWEACADPSSLLYFLTRRRSARKWRLLACGWLRCVWHVIEDGRSRDAVSVAERFADGEATQQELLAANWEADEAAQEEATAARAAALVTYGDADAVASGTLSSIDCYYDASVDALYYDAVRAEDVRHDICAQGGMGYPPEGYCPEDVQGWKAGRVAQAKLVRELFGNPFRPVTIHPEWRTSTVIALATSIYDDRAFDRMPILADALQDAGCENDDILNHLRDPNATHVRGCWALDLVLGKE